VTPHQVFITPRALEEAKELPGHMRQRIRRAIQALADDPRPANSKELNVRGLEQEVRRLRLDKWRVVYAITERDAIVDVLAVRKRPPYDYGDLDALLSELL
jgi:mRNA interferase RelE/StbE